LAPHRPCGRSKGVGAFVLPQRLIYKAGRLGSREVTSHSLDGHFVANELQKIAARYSHRLSARVGSDKVLFEGANFAGYNPFQIFEFAVGIAVKKSLYTATDMVLANVSLAKRPLIDRP
jgi:hypothetical protein